MTDPEPAPPSLRPVTLSAAAAERVLLVLQREGNELVADPDTAAEVAAQVEAIVASTLQWSTAWSGDREPDWSSSAIGDRRAAASVHPTVSLRAAAVLFREVLPLLTEQVDDADIDLVQLAVALHDVIGATILTAATSYVDHLLERLSTVHLEERRVIAGELHDRVAQGIMAATQRLRLQPAPIEDVEKILLDTLADTRAIALELRQLVGERRLDEAVDSYLMDIAPLACPVTMIQQGAPRRLPPLQQEQAFLIVREAVQNACKHAHANEVTVQFHWHRPGVRILIRDDGRGFDPASTDRSRMGLLISRERAEAIGAIFEIDATPGSGTIVELALHG